MLDSISDEYENFSLANRQRFDALDTILAYEDSVITNEQRLSSMEKALRMTSPDYSIDNLPTLMTDMEVQIMQYIANAYTIAEDYNDAIKLYCHLKNWENNKNDKYIASTKLVTICYNLSKCLGQVGKFSDCIDVAREGIRCCEYTENINMLPSCMYNCVWSLVRRNAYGDKEEAQGLIDKISELITPMTWNGDNLKDGIERIRNEFLN